MALDDKQQQEIQTAATEALKNLGAAEQLIRVGIPAALLLDGVHQELVYLLEIVRQNTAKPT